VSVFDLDKDKNIISKKNNLKSFGENRMEFKAKWSFRPSKIQVSKNYVIEKERNRINLHFFWLSILQ